jgi:endonuclease/exonuclease/phosphatase family metal-dependent hydrolase
LALIKAWVNRLQPDLIGFQEVLDPSHTQELLSDYHFYSEWMGTTSGIAIAARWPIHERQELWLPDDGKTTGGPALRGMINSPYGIIPFTCATTSFYMTHHGYKRERQMSALNELACGRTKNDCPAILVGDFNTDPESAEIRYLKGLQSLEGGSAYWCDAGSTQAMVVTEQRGPRTMTLLHGRRGRSPHRLHCCRTATPRRRRYDRTLFGCMQ